MSSSSWESVSKWYDSLVGQSGHYFHENLILPKLLTNPFVQKSKTFLDVACGQGIMARNLKREAEYLGIDISPSLISAAKERNRDAKKSFAVGDAASFDLPKKDFEAAFVILALQNIENDAMAIKNIFRHLAIGGRLFLVLNHPCFRIPRQSSWQKDDASSLLYRRLNLYMSSLKIPIKTNPGKSAEEKVTAFHRPLSYYFGLLKEAGFKVEDLQEWISDKKSVGACARMENRAREEFPLFLFIQAVKD